MDRHGLFGLTISSIMVAATLGAAMDLESSDRYADTVNAVLGDASWVARFGVEPGPDAPEQLRLRTHLEHVEHLLRSRPTGHLTLAQRAARARHLDRLAEYTRRGEFPRRTVAAGTRRPELIDSEGRICAVGYLIEQSAGWEMAGRIDAEWHGAYIEDMRLPLLDHWAEEAGFTRRELAMIQPAYRDPDVSQPFDTGLETSVMIAGAAGAGLNSYLAGRGGSSPVAAGAGVTLGIVGLTLGLSERANYKTGDFVVAGLAIAAGGWNLIELLGGSDEETVAPRSIPVAGIGFVPAAEAPPQLGIVLRWAH